MLNPVIVVKKLSYAETYVLFLSILWKWCFWWNCFSEMWKFCLKGGDDGDLPSVLGFACPDAYRGFGWTGLKPAAGSSSCVSHLGGRDLGAWGLTFYLTGCVSAGSWDRTELGLGPSLGAAGILSSVLAVALNASCPWAVKSQKTMPCDCEQAND